MTQLLQKIRHALALDALTVEQFSGVLWVVACVVAALFFYVFVSMVRSREETTVTLGPLTLRTGNAGLMCLVLAISALSIGIAASTSAVAPELRWAYSNECLHFWEKARFDDAKTECERGLEAATNDSEVTGAIYFNLGMIAECQGKVSEANALYQKSLDVRARPSNRNALAAVRERLATTSGGPASVLTCSPCSASKP